MMAAGMESFHGNPSWRSNVYGKPPRFNEYVIPQSKQQTLRRQQDVLATIFGIRSGSPAIVQIDGQSQLRPTWTVVAISAQLPNPATDPLHGPPRLYVPARERH